MIQATINDEWKIVGLRGICKAKDFKHDMEELKKALAPLKEKEEILEEHSKANIT